MSAIGVLLQLAYRLRRHFVASWSVARWLGTILAVAGVVLLIVQQAATWDVILVAALFLIYGVLMLWAGRKGFVHFQASPAAERHLERAPAASPLEAEERVSVRAAGPFTVHGQDQYYVDLEAEYETVRSREHIVLAHVANSGFLWVGSWPEDEVGHWYIFFQPEMLCQLRVGYLSFGHQSQLAIEIVYSPDGDSRQAVYLASEAIRLRQIWSDLLRDAPSDVRAPTIGAVG